MGVCLACLRNRQESGVARVRKGKVLGERQADKGKSMWGCNGQPLEGGGIEQWSYVLAQCGGPLGCQGEGD